MIKYAFIIPYRDRECHKHFFLKYMEYLLEDYSIESYEILFCHQNNNLPFNRGAMKNAGFLYIKEKYPENYKNIIFIFNDIDTLPYKKNMFNYDVNSNEIKHFYGFKFALGGIFSIRGEDFEKINGFPGLWSWGWEDTIIQERALNLNMKINRDIFYEYGSKDILHMIDGLIKNVSLKNRDNYKKKNIVDGLNTIKHLQYSKNEKTNMLDIVTYINMYEPQDNTVINAKLLLNNKIDEKNKVNEIKNENSFNFKRMFL